MKIFFNFPLNEVMQEAGLSNIPVFFDSGTGTTSSSGPGKNSRLGPRKLWRSFPNTKSRFSGSGRNPRTAETPEPALKELSSSGLYLMLFLQICKEFVFYIYIL